MFMVCLKFIYNIGFVVLKREKSKTAFENSSTEEKQLIFLASVQLFSMAPKR